MTDNESTTTTNLSDKGFKRKNSMASSENTKKKRKRLSSEDSNTSKLLYCPLSERQQTKLAMQLSSHNNDNTDFLSSPEKHDKSPTKIKNVSSTPIRRGAMIKANKKSPKLGPKSSNSSPNTSNLSTISQSQKKGRRINLTKRNQHGETKLHQAAIKGKTEEVKKLVALGIEIDAKDYSGWTALHEACGNNRTEIAKILLEANADVQKRSQNGTTPLHDAAANCNEKLIKLLLRYGADPDAKNDNNQTTYDVVNDDVLGKYKELVKKVLYKYADERAERLKKLKKLKKPVFEMTGFNADDLFDDSSGEDTNMSSMISPVSTVSHFDKGEDSRESPSHVKTEKKESEVKQGKIFRKEDLEKITSDSSSSTSEEKPLPKVFEKNKLQDISLEAISTDNEDDQVQINQNNYLENITSSEEEKPAEKPVKKKKMTKKIKEIPVKKCSDLSSISSSEEEQERSENSDASRVLIKPVQKSVYSSDTDSMSSRSKTGINIVASPRIVPDRPKIQIKLEAPEPTESKKTKKEKKKKKQKKKKEKKKDKVVTLADFDAFGGHVGMKKKKKDEKKMKRVKSQDKIAKKEVKKVIKEPEIVPKKAKVIGNVFYVFSIIIAKIHEWLIFLPLGFAYKKFSETTKTFLLFQN